MEFTNLNSAEESKQTVPDLLVKNKFDVCAIIWASTRENLTLLQTNMCNKEPDQPAHLRCLIIKETSLH